MIRLAPHLSLPVDLVTQTVAIIAKRRAGKSYTMRRLVEQLHRARQQVVVVDPKGDQWGLRSAADGKGEGLPFVILGGERGDVPLEADAGGVVARFLVESGASAVLDLSLFRKGEVARFMGGPSPPVKGRDGFLEALYRLKALEVHRTPMMLVIDEADAIAPQKPQHGEERMLGAAEDIVRRGGQRGLGSILVTQRSAVLNKNVLTQAEVLIALRTIAPQDLAALDAWIDVHGTREQRAELMASLPSLPVGDAWVWAPGWPSADGIFERVHVLPIETFDSGATPRPGEKRREPRAVAKVDLEALKAQMAETIARASADDPRALRARVAELETLVKAKAVARLEPVPTLSAKELGRLEAASRQIAEVGRRQLAALERITTTSADAVGKILEAIAPIVAKVSGARTTLLDAPPPVPPAMAAVSGYVPRPRSTPPVPPRAGSGAVRDGARADSPANGNGAGDPGVGKAGLRRILTALAQRNGLSRKQLALRAGVSQRSGTFDTYLSRARGAGWITGGPSRFEITPAGVAALGTFEPLPVGEALLEYWLAKFGTSGAARMLRALADAYPRTLSRAELAAAAGITDRSGTFDTYLSRLRGFELVVGDSGALKASDEFFAEGGR